MFDEKLYYLGSPYSHPNPAVVIKRFEDVCFATARLMDKGLHIFSPIAHTHPVFDAASRNKLPMQGGWEFWRDYDLNMIDRCDGLLVLMLDGWEKSVGLTAEIKHAEDKKMKVVYVNPETLGFQVRRNVVANDTVLEFVILPPEDF